MAVWGAQLNSHLHSPTVRMTYTLYFVPAVTAAAGAAISFRRSQVCNEIFTLSHLSNRNRLCGGCGWWLGGGVGRSSIGLGVGATLASPSRIHLHANDNPIYVCVCVCVWHYSFNYKTKHECIWYQTKTEATQFWKLCCHLSDGSSSR